MANGLRRLAHRRVLWTTAAVVASSAVLLALTTRPGEAPYTPGESVEGITNVRAKDDVPDPGIRFADVAREAGVSFRHFSLGRRSTQLPEDMGSGCAWGDYDGDGLWDLFVADFTGPLTASPQELAAAPGGSRLFKNRGDGTFADVTESAGLGDLQGFFQGAAWGDYDGDGRPDLFVTAYGRNRLFRNERDGRFRDVSTEAGVGTHEGFWSGAAWGDHDRDGDLDLYVCGYVDYRSGPRHAGESSSFRGVETPSSINPSSFAPIANLLFENRGDGRFREVAEELGVANPEGRSLSATFADLDEDGWPDLYVANDVSEGALFVNTRDGLFQSRGREAHVADYRGAMGLAVADADGDGAPDLFVTHWIAEGNALYVRRRPSATLDFEDAAERLGVGVGATADDISWGTAFVDADNDGQPDLFVATGSTFQDRQDPSKLAAMRSRLFLNRGERGFADVAPKAVPAFATPRVARGLAVADYDGDGREDVAVVVHGGELQLLRSQTAPPHAWISVRLRGTKSNTMGLGAKVRVTAGGRTQTREIGAGSSYLSQNAPEAHFGLGAADTVERLEIVWPSGLTQRFEHVAPSRVYRLVEGARELQDVTPPPPRRALSREEQLAFWQAYHDGAEGVARGDRAAAVRGFREALRLDPRHEDSLYGLGNVLFEAGDLPGARRELETLIVVNPMSVRGHAALGDLLVDPGAGALFDAARARALYEAASRINGEETGWVVRVAELAMASGDLPRARELLAHVGAMNPRSFQGPYLLGWDAFRRNDQARAAALFAKAVEALGPPPAGPAPQEGDVRRFQQPLPDRGVLREHWRHLRTARSFEMRPLYEHLTGVLERLGSIH